MEFEDRRKVTMHGKDIADGDGSAVSGMVKNYQMMTMGREHGIQSVTWQQNILVQRLNAIHVILERKEYTQQQNTFTCLYLKMQQMKNLLMLMLDTVDQAKITTIVPWEQQKKQLDWNNSNVLVDASLVLNFSQDVI